MRFVNNVGRGAIVAIAALCCCAYALQPLRQPRLALQAVRHQRLALRAAPAPDYQDYLITDSAELSNRPPLTSALANPRDGLALALLAVGGRISLANVFGAYDDTYVDAERLAVGLGVASAVATVLQLGTNYNITPNKRRGICRRRNGERVRRCVLPCRLVARFARVGGVSAGPGGLRRALRGACGARLHVRRHCACVDAARHLRLRASRTFRHGNPAGHGSGRDWRARRHFHPRLRRVRTRWGGLVGPRERDPPIAADGP